MLGARLPAALRRPLGVARRSVQARRAAARHGPGVSARLSRRETMLSTSVDEYFDIGAEAAAFLETCLVETGRHAPSSVLDFPCGHGRVLRMIAARWPQAVLTAGDTDVDGVDFCAAEFGAGRVYSRDDLDRVDAGGGMTWPSAGRC